MDGFEILSCIVLKLLIMQENNEFDRLVNKVKPLVKSWTRNRSGFGSFQHYKKLLWHTALLVKKSGIFVSPKSLSTPIFLKPDLLRLFISNYRDFYENILTNPNTFQPTTIWALFWALSTAEHQFMFRFTPFWSNEERLTGHFVSQIMERLEDFGVHWRQLTEVTQPSLSEMQVYYADTANESREAFTGADFGLIIQARYENQPEFFKVARFQAKKVEGGSAGINLEQVEALLQHEKLGYFLFYHRFDIKEWTPPPIVKPADFYQTQLEEFKTNKKKYITDPMNGYEKCWDFASFVTFGLADPASEYGVIESRADDAVSTLMAVDTSQLKKTTRVMIISIGDNVSVVDWEQLFREYGE
ncbi:MAG: hypothetical protein V7K62_30170 [Nostoc sp.]